MTPDEVVKKLNTENISIAELSVQCGLSEKTLKNRLADFDYEQDENEKWRYVGDVDKKITDIDITKKGRVSRPDVKKKRNKVSDVDKQDVDLFTALMQMPKSESVTRAYKTDKKIDEKFKQIAYETKLPITLLHSLALLEFVEKYQPIIVKLKSASKANV
ncbi:hypothetical protein [Psychrobacillus soli]|uniref:Uncharacterized protein n=1 Tax=Psychrobacillus soli TaxID=1543965 RepID=A0A544TBC1_9BACI|nr:hypothetical protein [Psychrobacillus soli]TQR14741.1 hypothetical protein FG383_10495 [Psychrobacillus soli]